MPVAPTAETPDLAGQFNSEWDQAQARYRAGINAGYNEGDADQMYLAPVRNKWEVLKSVPDDMKRRAATELDDAHLSFLKGIQSGYKAQDAENIYLKPAQMKWQAAASVPETRRPDPLLEHKMGALQEVQWLDPQRVMAGHPKEIFSDPKFVAQFEVAAQRGARERAAAATKTAALTAKAAEAQDPAALLPKLERLYSIGGSKAFQAAAPAPVVDALKNAVGGFENALTNAPARVRFNPPSEDIAAEHPGWTPAQVALGEQGKLKGAQSQRVFKDRSGARFTYKGTMADPTKDQDPNNWETVQ